MHDQDRLPLQCAQGLPAILDGVDLSLGDYQRAAGSDDLAQGDELLPVVGRDQLNLVVDVQRGRTGEHHRQPRQLDRDDHGCIAGGRVGFVASSSHAR